MSAHESEAEARARRLSEIFGEDFPTKVREDIDAARRVPRNGDDWLREQVPPHHGG